MKASADIVARRMADPRWVRRWKRSLGRNKHYRRVCARRHEIKERIQQQIRAQIDNQVKQQRAAANEKKEKPSFIKQIGMTLKRIFKGE